MVNFMDYSPCKVYQGVGTLSALKNLCSANSKILLITSAGMLKRDIFPEIKNYLACSTLFIRTVSSNPDLDNLDKLRDELLSEKVDQIVSLGGGSVMDAAKVLSVMLHPSNARLTLNDVLRKNISFTAKRLPLINIPTTSGTGAEVTPFATVWDFKNSKKKSFASEVLIPDWVILDAKTTFGSPEKLTVNCALDTCSHAMESLWNKNATERSVWLASEALKILVEELPKLLKEDSLKSREKLQIASFIAGLAISINRTAIAHSISYPVTLHNGMPHGLACAFTLPKIAHLISTQDAWVKGTDLELIQNVLILLDKLNLEKLVSEYCTKEQLLKLIPEMNTKGRADNFVLDDYSLETILS